MPEAVRTVGDPEAMRALATELLGRAELIGSAPTGASRTLDDATFEGAAADRLRGSVSDARSQVVDAASRLRDLASQLIVDAGTVERQNEALKAEAAADAKRAAAAAEASQGSGAAGSQDGPSADSAGSQASPTTDEEQPI